jgi:hypothetical protein
LAQLGFLLTTVEADEHDCFCDLVKTYLAFAMALSGVGHQQSYRHVLSVRLLCRLDLYRDPFSKSVIRMKVTLMGWLAYTASQKERSQLRLLRALSSAVAARLGHSLRGMKRKALVTLF